MHFPHPCIRFGSGVLRRWTAMAKAEACWPACPSTSPTRGVFGHWRAGSWELTGWCFSSHQQPIFSYDVSSSYSTTIPLAFLDKGSNLTLQCPLNLPDILKMLNTCRGEKVLTQRVSASRLVHINWVCRVPKAALHESSSQASTCSLLLWCSNGQLATSLKPLFCNLIFGLAI